MSFYNNNTKAKISNNSNNNNTRVRTTTSRKQDPIQKIAYVVVQIETTKTTCLTCTGINSFLGLPYSRWQQQQLACGVLYSCFIINCQVIAGSLFEKAVSFRQCICIISLWKFNMRTLHLSVSLLPPPPPPSCLCVLMQIHEYGLRRKILQTDKCEGQRLLAVGRRLSFLVMTAHVKFLWRTVRLMYVCFSCPCKESTEEGEQGIGWGRTHSLALPASQTRTERQHSTKILTLAASYATQKKPHSTTNQLICIWCSPRKGSAHTKTHETWWFV